ncbi:MAG: hypothetical protein WAO76_09175, partial [Georgfuchsia sp.]
MTTATMERPAETKPRSAVIVPPFGVEADNPQMCDLLIQSIPGCRLRSRIRPTTTTVDGQVRTPQTHGYSPPEVPGMQLHVNPAELSYVIMDPLNGDEDAKARIKRFLHLTTGARQDANLRGVDTRKGLLDAHRMKTLCREIVWLLGAGDVKVVKGAEPTMDDIDELPGNYLLNPGLRTATTQPTFEKDHEEWINQLTR